MRPRPSSYFLIFKLVLPPLACLLSPASAQLVNTTIDDTSGDPLTGDIILYEPASSWKSGNQSLCMNCTAHPDASRVSGETWHEGASFPSQTGGQSQVFTARVPFNGSAVCVYGIIAPFWRTDLAFYLDRERAGTFALEANTSRAYEYGVLLFASGALPLAAHTLTIQSGTTATGDGSDTLVLLDRVVYTHDSETLATSSGTTGASSTSFLSEPSTTSDPRWSSNVAATSPSNVYAITIPCVVGGMLVVGIAIAMWRKLWRRYKRGRLPPSALYRRSVGAGAGAGAGAGTQPPPESRWVKGDGDGGLARTPSTGFRAARELEAAAGDVGPRELFADERARSEQGRGTPHHGKAAAAEEIEEVSRS